MYRRLLLVGVGVLSLAGLLAAAATAQQSILPPPDAYVRGYGAIPVIRDGNSTARPNLGIFKIDVVSTGGRLLGGFHYYEVTPTGRRLHTIYSQNILSLNVNKPAADIMAKGVYTGGEFKGVYEACIGLHVEDTPKGDRLRISANGCFLDINYYFADGPVVRGDIVVWQRPAGLGYAKGEGVIHLGNTITANSLAGHFVFRAEQRPDGAIGMISYSEYDPVAASITPKVRIYVPKLEKMAVDGNKAEMAGKGWLNGRPVMVLAVAVDNRTPWPGPGPEPYDRPLIPDWFSIRAVSPMTSVDAANIVPVPSHQASGPVVKGDIVVGTYGPILE